MDTDTEGVSAAGMDTRSAAGRVAEFLKALERERVIAVMRGMPPHQVEEAAGALWRGGIRLMEVAFSHPGAGEALRRLQGVPLPGAYLGAGTVTDLGTLEEALAAGASFVVTPHVVPPVIQACVARGIPVVPGAFTPTEVALCLQMGAPAVKVFPASVLGPGYVRALLGPYPGTRLVPTGGVGGSNAAAFLQAGAFAVGVGGELFQAQGRDLTVAEIEERARQLVAAARSAGGSA